MNSDDLQDIITLAMTFIWLIISIITISFVAKYRELEFNRFWRLRVFLVTLLLLHALLSALSNLKWFPRQFTSLKTKSISCCVSNFFHQMIFYPFFLSIVTVLLKSSTQFSLIKEKRPNRHIIYHAIMIFLIPALLGIANIILLIFKTDILCFVSFDTDTHVCVAPGNYEFITIVFTVILILFLLLSFKKNLSESGINLHHQNQLRKIPFLYLPFIVVFAVTIAEPFVSEKVQFFFRYFYFVFSNVFMLVLIYVLVIKPTRESAQNPLERGHITARHHQIEAIPGLYDNEGNELEDFDNFETISSDVNEETLSGRNENKPSPFASLTPSQSKGPLFDAKNGEELAKVELKPPKDDQNEVRDPKLAKQLKNLDAILDDSDDDGIVDDNEPPKIPPKQPENNTFKQLDDIFSDDDDDGGLGPPAQNNTAIQPGPSARLIPIPTDPKAAKTFKDLDDIFSDDDDENEAKPAQQQSQDVPTGFKPVAVDQKGAKTFKELDAIFSDDDDDDGLGPQNQNQSPILPAPSAGLIQLPTDPKAAKTFKDLDPIFSDDDDKESLPAQKQEQPPQSNLQPKPEDPKAAKTFKELDSIFSDDDESKDSNEPPKQPQQLAPLQLPSNPDAVKQFQDVDAILGSDDDDIKPEPKAPVTLQLQPQQPNTVKKFQDVDAILGSDDDEPPPEIIQKPVAQPQPAKPGQLQIQPPSSLKPTAAEVQNKFKDLDDIFSDDDDDDM